MLSAWDLFPEQGIICSRQSHSCLCALPVEYSTPGLPPFVLYTKTCRATKAIPGEQLTLQVLNTHRAEAEAGGEERNKASLQFCLPRFTISTEDCPSSTPCCPQQFYIWFWFKTSLHYSAWISVLLHVVGLVLQDHSQGTFWGGFISFHLRWPIQRSGIFTQVLHVGTVLQMHVGFPLH